MVMAARSHVWLVAVPLVAMALAGCSTTTEDIGQNTGLRANKGAITGLLLDDRFRPIHLTDDPKGEFEAEGFILLQETGQRAMTTANGEFSFADLAPGQYTLRAAVSSHEAAPHVVVVTAGEFSEANIIARRVVSIAGANLTAEYNVFYSCNINYVVGAIDGGCDLDQSGEGYQIFFKSNFTTLPASFVVTEMRANQVSGYQVQLRAVNQDHDCGTALTGRVIERYAVAQGTTDSFRLVIEKDVVNTADQVEAFCPNVAWRNDRPFDTYFLIRGDLADELASAWPENDQFTPYGGVGIQFAVKGKFVQSVFLGPPEVDVASYCTLVCLS